MIAMTATVRPVDSHRVRPVLAHNLRRDHEHTLLFSDQMLVVVPEVGVVLVTEEPTTLRFDIVGNDQATVDYRMARLESCIRNHAGGQPIRVDWTAATQIPVPFR